MSGKIKYILLWAIGLACDLIAAVLLITYLVIPQNIVILFGIGVLFGCAGLRINVCSIVLARHIRGRKVNDEEWEGL